MEKEADEEEDEEEEEARGLGRVRCRLVWVEAPGRSSLIVPYPSSCCCLSSTFVVPRTHSTSSAVAGARADTRGDAGRRPPLLDPSVFPTAVHTPPLPSSPPPVVLEEREREVGRVVLLLLLLLLLSSRESARGVEVGLDRGEGATAAPLVEEGRALVPLLLLRILLLLLSCDSARGVDVGVGRGEEEEEGREDEPVFTLNPER